MSNVNGGLLIEPSNPYLRAWERAPSLILSFEAVSRETKGAIMETAHMCTSEELRSHFSVSMENGLSDTQAKGHFYIKEDLMIGLDVF